MSYVDVVEVCMHALCAGTELRMISSGERQEGGFDEVVRKWNSVPEATVEWVKAKAACRAMVC